MLALVLVCVIRPSLAGSSMRQSVPNSVSGILEINIQTVGTVDGHALVSFRDGRSSFEVTPPNVLSILGVMIVCVSAFLRICISMSCETIQAMPCS